MTDIDKRLAEIRERVEAATPGPWQYRETVFGARSTTVMAGSTQVGYFSVGQAMPTDAKFIAHSRSDIPFLLAELDKRQAAIDAVHRPHFEKTFGYDICVGCSAQWPCPTVQAVHTALEGGGA